MTEKPAAAVGESGRVPADAPTARTAPRGLAEKLRVDLSEHLARTPTSQAVIARQIGITPKHLSQMLTGRAALTLPWAERIADAAGADITVTVTPRFAVDPPEEIPLARCPRWRVHRPHTWTSGGPLKACPGVTDEPEETTDA